MNIKLIARQSLPPQQFKLARNTVRDIMALGHGKNLSKLAKVYNTDKFRGHYYAPHYQDHFRKFRNKEIKLLEIGVGGYGNPMKGGNSLRMWKKYFPKGQIYAIDIFDKSFLKEARIRIFQGSQVDKEFLERVLARTGPLDLIIDDGSHMNEHVIRSFQLLFPYLKDGGIYVVEDTQTSYWPDFGGDSNDLDKPSTMMNYFKSLTDSLNHQEIINPDYKPTYFDKKIVSMHFYHNLIFIYKGNNNEESNIVKKE
jgi:hypothetical protein